MISMCAGQGRDVLGVLAHRQRAGDVSARLVESDARNAHLARQAASPFAGVEVLEADAGCSDAYARAVPADIVLACGVFGNISDDDIRRMVSALPYLCAPGAVVIWTRHRQEPDLTRMVRRWFEETAFTEEFFGSTEDALMAVGSHRFTGEPWPFREGQYLFRFIGRGS
jgi:hypothetical protein